jgi:predicted O-methyltransferase YrrM
MHQAHRGDSWHRLDETAISGKPTRPRASTRSEEEREAFLMGMFNIAMGTAPGVVKEIDLADRKHLLDLGGGPGTWAIHFCLANPDLRATIFDLPKTLPFAEKTIGRFNLSDRVVFRGGDYLEDEVTGQYDTVWMSQILHGEGPESCRVMIRKALSVLESGGLILVHDFILNNDLAGPLQPALFSLNMLTGTESGRAYSEGQIMDMLADAGAKDLRRLPIQTPNESGVISGTAP